MTARLGKRQREAVLVLQQRHRLGMTDWQATVGEFHWGVAESLERLGLVTLTMRIDGFVPGRRRVSLTWEGREWRG